MENEDRINDIAIIGLSGRFPNAEDIYSLQQHLRNGTECIHFFTDDELRNLGVEEDTLANPAYVKACSMFPQPDYFDAHFFHYSTKEARLIDPQQRCFLECAWAALENAGYAGEPSGKSVGVFAGESTNIYLLDNVLHQRLALNLDFMNFMENYITSDKDFLATRVSYKLNLTGPSLTVQTACSTALVAIHLACQSLLTGECDMALAGAVTVRLPAQGYWYKKDGMVSPDGHCRTFSAESQGTIFGSGVGVVVLKRLADAIADKDYIWAVIKSSAINNDGATKLNYTAPSVDKQTDVVLTALAQADIDPETITYIEAHGTGTPIGDPVEITALTQAFRSYTDKKQFCAIGSIKTNMGHLDAASGMAGLMKTVLSLHNKELYPTLHFIKPNPKIDFANSPFYVNTHLTPWKQQSAPLRAGLTALGVGGTNAHVILEEAPELSYQPSPRKNVLLPFSAKTTAALKNQLGQFKNYLETQKTLVLSDAAYTLQVGRHAFSHREVILANSKEQAVNSIEKILNDPSYISIETKNQPNLNFVIPQISDCDIDVIYSLIVEEPQFFTFLEECFQAAQQVDEKWRAFSLSKIKELIDQENDIFLKKILGISAVYALAKLLISWDVRPEIIYAQSNGEVIAGCLTGLLSLEEMWKLILHGNGNSISMKQASHSLYFSSHDQWINAEEELPSIPWDEITAYQHSNIEALYTQLDAKDGKSICLFLDFIPHANIPSHCYELFDMKSEKNNGYVALLNLIAKLWKLDVTIEWDNFNRLNECHRIPLPTYPFERKRYHLPNLTHTSLDKNSKVQHASDYLINQYRHYPIFKNTLYEVSLSTKHYPYLQDHQVYDLLIIPAALHISMALSAAGLQYRDHGSVLLKELLFSQALFIDAKDGRDVQLTVDTNKPSTYSYQLISFPVGQDEQDGKMLQHSSGVMQVVEMPTLSSIDLAAIQMRCSEALNVEDFYHLGKQAGFGWGPHFQCVKKLWRGKDEMLGFIEHPDIALPEMAGYSLHPTILDACLQPYLALLPVIPNAEEVGGAYIPMSIDAIHYFKKPSSSLWTYIKLHNKDRNDGSHQETYIIDVTIINDKQETICLIEGLHLKYAAKSVLTRVYQESQANHVTFFYQPAWKPLILPDVNHATLLPETIMTVGYPEDFSAFSGLLHAVKERSRIIRVILNDHYQESGENEIHINRFSLDDYQKLLTQFSKITAIYFLDASSHLRSKNENFYEQDISVIAFFRLVKILLSNQHTNDIQLNILTAGAHLVNDQDDALNPYASPLIGAAKVLAREAQQFKIACIDFSLNELLNKTYDQARKELLYQILSYQVISTNIPEVASRKTHCLVKKLVPTANLSKNQQPFKQDGCYIVIGGGRGIGSVIAQHLAEHYHVALVLVGRSAESDYASLIKILRTHSKSVMYIRADITIPQDVEYVLKSAQENFSHIHGVINCAGTLADRSLLGMSEDEFRYAFLPKAKGLDVFYQVFKDEALDFFITFSSENALRGNAGQANYVAGCVFQDVYTNYLHHYQHFPCKVINWGWWGEAGMAANPALRDTVMGYGLLPISNQEGVAALKQIINSSPVQLAYIKAEKSLFDALQIDHADKIAEHKDESTAVVLDQLLSLPYQQRVTRLTDIISQHLAKQLQITEQEINHDAPLSTLGLDSLLAISFRNELSKIIAKPLSATLIFDYPSIHAIVNYIAHDLLRWQSEAVIEQEKQTDDLEKLNEEQLTELLLKKLGESSS